MSTEKPSRSDELVVFYFESEDPQAHDRKAGIHLLQPEDGPAVNTCPQMERLLESFSRHEGSQRNSPMLSGKLSPTPQQSVSPTGSAPSESSSSPSKRSAEEQAYRTAARVQDEILKRSSVVEPKLFAEVPRFECDQVILGKRLGSGRFCHVAQVRRINSTEPCLVNDNVKRRIVDQASRDHYALKFLQNGLSPEMYRHGAAQLVVEMILLSSLRHPNIIKIWGVSREGPLGFKTGRGYFILIDRLQNTLDDEMKIWRQQNLSEKSALKSSMIQRLQVAADISSALAYLHSRRILYRSLDPRNLAFNDEGKIVLFDFGLARELDDTKLSEDGRSYRLSGNKGNPFYMAPEVALCEPYGTAADVYSMAILLWHICSLANSPFPGLGSRDDFINRIVKNQERPKINPSWSETLQYLLRSSWVRDPVARPPIKHFQRSILHEIQDIQEDLKEPRPMKRETVLKPLEQPEISPPNTDNSKSISVEEVLSLCQKELENLPRTVAPTKRSSRNGKPHDHSTDFKAPSSEIRPAATNDNMKRSNVPADRPQSEPLSYFLLGKALEAVDRATSSHLPCELMNVKSKPSREQTGKRAVEGRGVSVGRNLPKDVKGEENRKANSQVPDTTKFISSDHWSSKRQPAAAGSKILAMEAAYAAMGGIRSDCTVFDKQPQISLLQIGVDARKPAKSDPTDKGPRGDRSPVPQAKSLYNNHAPEKSPSLQQRPSQVLASRSSVSSILLSSNQESKNPENVSKKVLWKDDLAEKEKPRPVPPRKENSFDFPPKQRKLFKVDCK